MAAKSDNTQNVIKNNTTGKNGIYFLVKYSKSFSNTITYL